MPKRLMESKRIQDYLQIDYKIPVNNGGIRHVYTLANGDIRWELINEKTKKIDEDPFYTCTIPMENYVQLVQKHLANEIEVDNLWDLFSYYFEIAWWNDSRKTWETREHTVDDYYEDMLLHPYKIKETVKWLYSPEFNGRTSNTDLRERALLKIIQDDEAYDDVYKWYLYVHNNGYLEKWKFEKLYQQIMDVHDKIRR